MHRIHINAPHAIESILLGCALGDACGWPFEFDREVEIREKIGTNTDLTQYAELWTDDTQMTLASVAPIAFFGRNKTVLPFTDEAYGVIWEAYQQWLITQNIPGQSRAPGLTVTRSLRGSSRWGTFDNTINDSKGNGTIMRSGLYGVFNLPSEVLGFAASDSYLTHSHTAAAYSACFHALMNWNLLRATLGLGASMEDLVSSVNSRVYNFMRELVLSTENTRGQDKNIRIIEEMFKTVVNIATNYKSMAPTSETAYMFMDDSGAGTADTTLYIALFALLKFNNFHDAIYFCVVNNGDSDTYGAVYGSMYGAACFGGQQNADILGIARNFEESPMIYAKIDASFNATGR